MEIGILIISAFITSSVSAILGMGGGIILLITGVLILTNSIQVISYYILTTFPFLTKLG